MSTISYAELHVMERNKGLKKPSFPMNLVWLVYKKYNQNFTKKLKGILM